ncbi:uncharacterized protein LOC112527931 isoform X1 [Cynara cardunculus var. scolymus]|uniref:uncharacterized protein LOC112527931 isoform X1 n=1 Tax=Cynara cardunculus var. scolymus TaxID=59895 RepID=UPI000D627751|nr:uncharacterized protein LOC112527931 isoform X1 [Cynara cardunculus var. scolymus]XP_024994560.1 uncharacterized protein LOC112527931 isoform X1 [Cynara cardunculus var. scolymus]
MSATATAVSAAEKPVRRFPPPCWTQDEALALIQAYRERWYALRRGYLRTADWDAVAEEVGRICPGAIPPKTSAQCRHKMEKLRQRYRAEKQRALSFPGGQFLSTWFYFEAMDSMEKNGNGSNPDEETQSGNDLNSSCIKIVSLKNNHESNTIVDSGYGGLNPGRGIRFKPVAADGNLVTIATRSNNFRVSNNYAAQEEDNNDEFEDGYYVETPIGKNLGRTHKLSSQNYATRFQSDHHSNDGVHLHPSNFQDLEHSGVRPRKFSKTSSNSNHGYWNENGQDHDDVLGEDEVWMKKPKDRSMDFKEKLGDRIDRNSGHHYFDSENGSNEFSREKRGIKQDDDSIGQIVSSIKLLADGFVKMEKMKMDMVHEIEKMRMEAEMKRNELLLESQKQIVEAFVKGLAENKKQQQ